jgi:transcriptional regulator with XRE-family HTH domain
MAQISPHRRPYYPPTERMAILELRAARGWSREQTADAFLVTAATISSWIKRVDEDGPDALVQLREPVNKFPEFVRYAVRLLKAGLGQRLRVYLISIDQSRSLGIRLSASSKKPQYFRTELICTRSSGECAP